MPLPVRTGTPLGDGCLVLALPRLDVRGRGQETHLEIRVDLQSGTHAVEEAAQDAARFGRVLGQVLSVCQPIARQHRVVVVLGRLEDLDCLSRRLDRFQPTSQPAQRLGLAAQQLCQRQAVGRVGDERFVCVGGVLPASGSREEIRLEPRPARIVAGEEVGGRHVQSFGDEVQCSDGGLGVALLERADVGLGVATLGQLRLCQAAAVACDANAFTNPLRQGRLVNNGSMAFDCRHQAGVYTAAKALLCV
jgi:hypothetical protein